MRMQKFIITHEGVFKYGNVRMHKDLLGAKDLCIGGGYYEFDYVSNRLLLSGKSYDFGQPKWHYITVLKVPTAFRGLSILYEGEDVRKFLRVEYV